MNWTISNLDSTLPDGCVTVAHWRVSKTDGNASGSVYGTISLPHKDQRSDVHSLWPTHRSRCRSVGQGRDGCGSSGGA